MSKSGPAVATIGILALIGAAISLFRGESGLNERVESYFRRVSEATSPLTGTGDVQAQIVEVEGFIGDKEFAKLSKEKQEKVEGHKKELLAYRDYEADVARITPPEQISLDTDLRRITKNLEQIAVPADYQVDFSKTPAGKKHRQMLVDARALDKTVNDMAQVYGELHKDARHVIDNASAADLPGRAQKVLDRAALMPNPQKDARQPIPNATDVTYGTVFAFAPVKEAYAEWLKDREVLAKLARK